MDYMPIVLDQPCAAARVPGGEPITLPAGARVRVTEALGGSVILLTEDGELVRVAEEARARLGVSELSEPEAPEKEGLFELTRVWDELRTLHDPALPVNVVELGLVYRVEARELPDGSHRVEVTLSMTEADEGRAAPLQEEAQRKLLGLPGVSEVHVEVVLEPRWDRGRASEAARMELGWM